MNGAAQPRAAALPTPQHAAEIERLHAISAILPACKNYRT